MATVTFAVCTLNQWAMDFKGNLRRILQSVKEAAERKACYRLGSDLEICGYNCQDHFYEQETSDRCWESAAYLIENVPEGIVCDVGMPVRYDSKLYNCRIIFTKRQIYCVKVLNDVRNGSDGSAYREDRWFSKWPGDEVIHYELPVHVAASTDHQSSVPMGSSLQLWLRNCCHLVHVSTQQHPELDQAAIYMETAPKYFVHGESRTRLENQRKASTKCRLLLTANMTGSDGDRMLFDGGSSAFSGGRLLAIDRRFSLDEVSVALVSLDAQETATKCDDSQRLIELPLFESARTTRHQTIDESPEQQEVINACACWLWDHLRRSGGAGFFLPLSGGIDSGFTACIIYHLCKKVLEENKLSEFERVTGVACKGQNAADLCNTILTTAYLSTKQSSSDSRQRSCQLAKQIGSYHFCYSLDATVSAVLSAFQIATKFMPKFAILGGSQTENTALQNLQARLRMVVSYLFSQLVPVIRQNDNRFLLVLGTGNADESLLGYFTKYDCSSADLNPLGGMSKNCVRRSAKQLMELYNIPILEDILKAKPSAELQPLAMEQTDEQDLGITYDQIEEMAHYRAIDRLGPRQMSSKIGLAAANRFNSLNRRNRHKTTVGTPAMLCQPTATDDCRSDFRPFTYPPM